MDFLIILALAFVPMFGYLAILWWFDRYEKEPFGLLLMAFIWGAGPSIILALIAEIVFDIPLQALGSGLLYEWTSSSIVAPLVEEGVKALALVGLMLFVHREIDSPMDGMIYGGVVGFGFSAVENVLYFLNAYSSGGMGNTVYLALLRAVLFGANHAMFTGFTGLGMALSLETRHKGLKALWMIGGFGLAVAAHAFHNTFSTFWGYTDGSMPVLATTAIADWIGIAVLLGVVVWSYFLERGHIRRYAQALVNVHFIPQEEIAILQSTNRRTFTRLNALLSGDWRRWRLLGKYYQRITTAAFTWHRMQTGDRGAQERLRRLEGEIATLRAQLYR